MEQQTTPVSQTNIVIVGKAKSTGTAFILAFLFGPLGLLYATVPGGLIMIVLALILFFVLPLVGPIITWIVSIIWAVAAANAANSKLHSQAGSIAKNQP